MKSVFPSSRFRKRLGRRFLLWLLLAVLAATLILAWQYFHNLSYGRVSSRINYNFSGIERGVDPSGNRFDVSEIRQAALVRQAADAAGLQLDEAALEQLGDQILIVGSVSPSWIEAIISPESIFTDDGIADRMEVRESSYFPNNYTVYVSYLNSGLTQAQGRSFLDALLSAYTDYFYQHYGYNQAIEEIIQTIDYRQYDYPDSMEILDASLSSLRSFLSRLAGGDNSRFRSDETGYTLEDLIDAIDTIRSEDLDWLNFYIDSNNVTKNLEERIAVLNYRIEAAQREQRAEESNLETLNGLIEGYEKTNAVILSLGSGNTGSTSLEEFQFSQQSDTYDSMVSRRIALQTGIRETQERIALYESRIARVQDGAPEGSVEIVEGRLAQVDEKLKELLSLTNRTVSEYYSEVKLQNALYVFPINSSGAGRAVSLVRGAMTDLLAAEGLLFGLYLLDGILFAMRGRKAEAGAPRKEAATAGQARQAEQEKGGTAHE